MEHLHVDQVQKSTDELKQDFLALLTPEQRLAGLTPEQIPELLTYPPSPNDTF